MFRSLVDGAKRLATNGNGAAPAPMDGLFAKTDPAVDGDDCAHDCASCTVHYPRSFKIDHSDRLYGLVKGWSTHLLVATGKTDWVRDVADEKGSVMEAVAAADAPKNGKLMLSASNIPTPSHSSDYAEPTRVLLLPAFVVVDHVTPALVPSLLETLVSAAPTNDSALVSLPGPDPPAPSPPTTSSTATASTAPAAPAALAEPAAPAAPLLPALPPPLALHASPHSVLVLLCSQKTRDARCGQSAPLIRKELERHLRPLGLARDLDDERPGGVGIYFISHVGGHKYSANMMVYRRPDPFGIDGVARAALTDAEREALPARIRSAVPAVQRQPVAAAGASQCIWLARVAPEDCENIVKYTILQGKVVKPESQLRGGFDREKGLLSW